MNQKDQKRIQIEKKALGISLYGSVFFVFAEGIMAIFTGSQSILMDAVYGGADLIMVIVSIRIVPLLYRPMTEKHPFGFSQVEAIFITIKGAMLTAVTVGLVLNNIQIILRGGNHVEFTWVAAFELAAAVISGGILYALIQKNRKLDSLMVHTEINAWIIDTVASMGLALAFVLPALIQTEWMHEFAPYLDQAVAITLSALILPVPIKTMLAGLRDVFLLAPDEASLDRIKEIGQTVLAPYRFEQTVYDVIKTGRKLWISIYFKSPSDTISISQIIKAHKELETVLKKEYKDLYVELIPEFEPQVLDQESQIVNSKS
ncbi:cation transporter [Anoxybacterium hadale]|uniref:Cation transporter n=1 Tax=Anoxybacterium hadale TaxID=3408580 RepID=A0ACD1ACA7_9FIRM|nr:cation transporter [Clostridiales bacterium]